MSPTVQVFSPFTPSGNTRNFPFSPLTNVTPQVFASSFASVFSCSRWSEFNLFSPVALRLPGLRVI
ncbi:TPA: hypothetical protein LDJ26_004734 [Salmonella enterica subsp. enterica serovar Kentucky]|nr:hypothetical protein [Salmonella enterica]ELR3467944.1 hypothetical protein [Salmonella enterica]HBJ7493432.1 hypothetical protein [Salmonella enterica subsp. enterica serovar Kentucky]HBJ7493643.1 hypothetical protein [Salmonella enterica subsp. enterica serovar Kentucky]